ncbi:MAG: sigma-70 family RNA polymerase sigma factor [Myxococcota bacterium]|nr:sigma-70 family RNA polymerase sigma factor [Myxococcota bacterium]
MGLGEDSKTILEKYGPYVRSLASQVRKQFSANLELDELISYGQVGLLEAAERFDPKVGANFLTFAHYRIKGAIFDGLRKMGILRGSDSRSSYVGERANAYLGNLSDREQGGGNRGHSVGDDVMEVANAVSGLAALFGASLEGSDGLNIVDESLPADQRLEMEQLKRRVRAAIEKLPEKERKLLEGYYFQGKTLEEAGAEIGQSKSWASRLHARAIETLKQLLEDEDQLPSEKNLKDPKDPSRRSAHGGTTDERAGRGAAGSTGTAAAAAVPGAAAQAGAVKI